MFRLLGLGFRVLGSGIGIPCKASRGASRSPIGSVVSMFGFRHICCLPPMMSLAAFFELQEMKSFFRPEFLNRRASEMWMSN